MIYSSGSNDEISIFFPDGSFQSYLNQLKDNEGLNGDLYKKDGYMHNYVLINRKYHTDKDKTLRYFPMYVIRGKYISENEQEQRISLERIYGASNFQVHQMDYQTFYVSWDEMWVEQRGSSSEYKRLIKNYELNKQSYLIVQSNQQQIEKYGTYVEYKKISQILSKYKIYVRKCCARGYFETIDGTITPILTYAVGPSSTNTYDWTQTYLDDYSFQNNGASTLYSGYFYVKLQENKKEKNINVYVIDSQYTEQLNYSPDNGTEIPKNAICGKTDLGSVQSVLDNTIIYDKTKEEKNKPAQIYLIVIRVRTQKETNGEKTASYSYKHIILPIGKSVTYKGKSYTDLVDAIKSLFQTTSDRVVGYGETLLAEIYEEEVIQKWTNGTIYWGERYWI